MTDKIREFIENNDIDGMPIGTLEVGINRLFVELYEKVLQVTPENYGEGETFTKLSDVLDAFKDFGVEFPTSPQGEQQ